MKFDIFGRKTLQVVRQDGRWLAFYCGEDGVRRKADDLRIPGYLPEQTLETYLADIFHEWAQPGHDTIRRL